jgi:RNA polymerase sigma factor (sigma-70 family)
MSNLPKDSDPPPTLVQLEVAMGGDKEAFGALLERYGCRVRAWVRGAGVTKAEDLEDVEQEVKTKLFKALPHTSFAAIGQFRAYVKSTAENAARDHLRRNIRNKSKRHVESMFPDSSAEIPVVGREASPATLANREELLQVRRERIAKLTAPEQELIRMREDLGMQFDAIAMAQTESLARSGIDKVVKADGVRMKYGRLLEKVGPPLEL